ncbi:leucine zipper domain-containing protein [Enterobacter intestinihominis]
MSRKTGYKWLQRFDPSDLSSLSDRSRGPPTQTRALADYIARHLNARRQKNPDRGLLYTNDAGDQTRGV